MSDHAQHARLGPSGAHRWLYCTKAPTMEDGLPNRDSVHSIRGTFGHKLTEHCLKSRCNADDRHLPIGWTGDINYDAEMVEAVQFCLDFARAKIAEAKRVNVDAQFAFETKLGLNEWVPHGFGTSDFTVICDNTLDVSDWKFGRGVRVDAAGTGAGQLRQYALGMFRKYEGLFHLDRVRLTVVQPLLNHVDTDEISIQELVDWGENFLKPRALIAHNGEGASFAPGPLTCRWCLARDTCKPRANYHMAIVKEQAAHTLSMHEVAYLLPRLEGYVKWAHDIQDRALAAALGGEEVPGHKLVEGRSTRKYSDPAAVVALLEHRVAGSTYLEPRAPIGITAMEAALGRKQFAELLGGLVHKPPGKPVLVVAGDKRPAMVDLLRDPAHIFGEHAD